MTVREDDKILDPKPYDGDEQLSIRPLSIHDFIGQETIIKQIDIFIKAAKQRKVALDHVLLFGPPGLGKTTLATIIANEMHAGIKHTSGPVLEKAGDVAAILTNLKENDVLFIDEIHRLSPIVEETLYPAMEDYELDIMIGEGPGARSIKIQIPKFTLIGATTKAGLLTSPLRGRFGISHRLEFYSPEQLQSIIIRSAGILALNITKDAAYEIGLRARGTPRIANRLLKRIGDIAYIKANGNIDMQTAKQALKMLEIDDLGLDTTDVKYLKVILEKFKGGPVGVSSIAASFGEDVRTIEDVIEPYLLQEGYIMRTPKGRVVSDSIAAHVLNVIVEQS